ncbi:MAG TPA: enoyl-CoA hydratase-related protein, partial [Acidimicrobiales bacterium]
VRTEAHGRVTIVVIDRPHRRNAVDHATLVALQAALEQAAQAASRVLVLTGDGGAFCAGADLTGVEDDGFVVALSRVLHGLAGFDGVTIAAVDGPALGAGTQLALACDLRVATPSSRFGIPAAKLGLAIDAWTVDRLAAEVGSAIARAMLVAATTYTAEQLHAVGAVHRLGTLEDALRWADEIAALAPLTIRAHKVGLAALADVDLGERFEEARLAAWASVDATEGRTAFLEKRRPEFRGR